MIADTWGARHLARAFRPLSAWLDGRMDRSAWLRREIERSTRRHHRTHRASRPAAGQ